MEVEAKVSEVLTKRPPFDKIDLRLHRGLGIILRSACSKQEVAVSPNNKEIDWTLSLEISIRKVNENSISRILGLLRCVQRKS
jgi:hypothetical protein